MINIFELKPPRKISGVSSFGITFGYNPAIWDFLKSYGAAAYYHKKDYTWEIPVDLLAQTLDTLTFYDEITLRLVPDNDTSKTDHFRLTEDEVLSFRFKPFEHQIEGVNFGLDPQRPKWLLLDSMGLGKTNEIIMYAETLKRRGLIDHCMIICGVDSLRQNWKNEIRKFSTESCMVLGEKISKKGRISYETLKKRAEILRGPISEFFVIVNAATLRSEDFIEAFKKSPNKFGLIAVDEAHRFAIEYHRSLRSKEQVHSVLDDIPGIGPARRKALMKSFVNIGDIKEATVEELAAIPGIPLNVAKDIYSFFHSSVVR